MPAPARPPTAAPISAPRPRLLSSMAAPAAAPASVPRMAPCARFSSTMVPVLVAQADSEPTQATTSVAASAARNEWT